MRRRTQTNIGKEIVPEDVVFRSILFEPESHTLDRTKVSIYCFNSVVPTKSLEHLHIDYCVKPECQQYHSTSPLPMLFVSNLISMEPF